MFISDFWLYNMIKKSKITSHYRLLTFHYYIFWIISFYYLNGLFLVDFHNFIFDIIVIPYHLLITWHLIEVAAAVSDSDNTWKILMAYGN